MMRRLRIESGEHDTREGAMLSYIVVMICSFQVAECVRFLSRQKFSYAQSQARCISCAIQYQQPNINTEDMKVLHSGFFIVFMV